MTNNVIAVDFANKSKINNEKITSKDAEKHSLFNTWLTRGTVMVTFITNHPLVKIPSEFADKPLLNLNFCYNFHISDFSFNDQAIWGTLSFDSGDHFCRVPWASIVAIHSLALNQSQTWLID